MRIARAALLLSFLGICSLPAQAPGIKDALGALPKPFVRQIVRISADNGRPNPLTWYILARNASEGGWFVNNPLYSITIRGGNLVEAKRYVDVRQLLNWEDFVSTKKINLDAAEAFAVARKALGPKGKAMLTASYVMTQKGRSADPVWAVYGYGKSNRYLGEVKLSARTGAIISATPARF